MSVLLIPEHQPNFPLEDVSDKNAVLFEQLLLDPNYIFTIHELAEQHVTAFKLGHATIRSLACHLQEWSAANGVQLWGNTVRGPFINGEARSAHFLREYSRQWCSEHDPCPKG